MSTRRPDLPTLLMPGGGRVTPDTGAKPKNPEGFSDEEISRAVQVVLEEGKATQKLLQTKLGIAPKEAGRLLRVLETQGVISEHTPGRSREILVTQWPPKAEEPPEEEVEDAEDVEDEEDDADEEDTEDEDTQDEEDEDYDDEDEDDEDSSMGAIPAGVVLPPLVTPARVTATPAAPPTPPATPPAAPSPAPSPDATEPGTPPAVEAPPTAEEAESADAETEKTGVFSSIASKFRGAYERFTSKFRGEVQPEEEKDHKATWSDFARNGVMGLMSVVGSYTGVKFFYDLSARGWQSLISNPAERKRIQEAFLAKETEVEGAGEPSAVEQKKAKLEEAINASKFLTKERKAELLTKLQATVDTYEAEDKTLRTERDQKIADLLKEAIQTRVKNTQLLKEGLNTVLMATGLSTMRGVAYGAVASYERYQKVSQERAEGKRTGSQFNEWIVKGFTETAHNLVGGGAETWPGKGLNFVKGATNVLRVAGFANLARMEIVGEGFWSAANPVEQLEKLVQDVDAKGLKSTLIDNILTQWEPLTSMVKGVAGGTGVDTADGTTTPPSPDAGTPSPAPVPSLEAGGAGTAAAAEAVPHVEYPETVVESGTVQRGDGILKILERQGVHPQEALKAAQEAGIVRAGGDTRLTTEAIGRLSVLSHQTPDGHVTINFLDTQTGQELTLAQAHEAGFTYESGTVPGAIPTEAEGAAAELTRAHEGDIPPVEHRFEATPGVSHDLAGGGIHLVESPQGLSIEAFDTSHLTDTQMAELAHILNEPLIEEALKQQIELSTFEMQAAAHRLVESSNILSRLEATGHGDSPEANYLRWIIEEDLRAIEPLKSEIFNAKHLEDIQDYEGSFDEAALSAGSVEGDRIVSINVRGLGEVEFTYDEKGVPSLDWAQLAEQSKPFIEKQATELLVPHWEEALSNHIIAERLAQGEIDNGGPIILMLEAIKELEADGHGDSSEAKFLHEQLAMHLKGRAAILDGTHPLIQEAVAKVNVGDVIEFGHTVEPESPVEVATAPVKPEPHPRSGPTPETPHETGPLHQFQGEDAKVKFRYNRYGEVTGAFIPAHTATRAEIEAALGEHNLSIDQVKDHYLDKRHGVWSSGDGVKQTHYAGDRYSSPLFHDTSAQAEYEHFTDAVARLDRQETTLREMEEQGFASTPEYAEWKEKTDLLKKWVDTEMKKEFPSATR